MKPINKINKNDASTRSILIVDDSEDSRSYCEVMARMFNAKVVGARNVDHAMEILSAGVVPDVLLLDLVMPGRRPEELVTRVRSDKTLAGTKVVIMSALNGLPRVVKKLGANACIHKPFTMSRFVNVTGL